MRRRVGRQPSGRGTAISACMPRLASAAKKASTGTITSGPPTPVRSAWPLASSCAAIEGGTPVRVRARVGSPLGVVRQQEVGVDLDALAAARADDVGAQPLDRSGILGRAALAGERGDQDVARDHVLSVHVAPGRSRPCPRPRARAAAAVCAGGRPSRHSTVRMPRSA